MKIGAIDLRHFNWEGGPFLIGYHIAVLVGLPIYLVYFRPSSALLIASAVLLFLTQIGIGGAYHRFYAHRGYSLAKPAEAVLLFLATVATQGSALRWSFEHRKHHAYVDTDKDPHSIHKGFWYAHCLWLLKKSDPIDERRVSDLVKNKLVMFQHRYYAWVMVASNALMFLLIGWIVGDFLGAFVIAWWARLLVSHHLTWFINSIAHTWGERTYSKEHTAVDNYVLAMLTVGEGYHNFHHTFASDYRNGVRWYHFDPTKWTIWTLSKVGLASNLRRFSNHAIKKRLLVEDRRLLLATLNEQAHASRVELEQRIEQLATCIREKLTLVSTLMEEAKELRKKARAHRKHAAQAKLRELRAEIKALKRSLRNDWRDWSQLCGVVLQPQPA